MGYEFIAVEVRDHLMQVTIKRPEVLNALHQPAHEELNAAFDEFQDNSELWVALLTGAGDRAFCVGDDLKYRTSKGSENITMPKNGFGGITRRFDCFKPIVAAVNGFALGGGFEIALACDVIVAAEHALFGLPEPRMGMVAATGVHRLPRQIPYHLALGLILTGKRISVQEAFRFGIVNEIVPLENLKETAEKWAKEILECAPLSVRASKEAANTGLTRSLKEALSSTYPLEAMMKTSEDYGEGPRAFAEKRKPSWKGR